MKTTSNIKIISKPKGESEVLVKISKNKDPYRLFQKHIDKLNKDNFCTYRGSSILKDYEIKRIFYNIDKRLGEHQIRIYSNSTMKQYDEEFLVLFPDYRKYSGQFLMTCSWWKKKLSLVIFKFVIYKDIVSEDEPYEFSFRIQKESNPSQYTASQCCRNHKGISLIDFTDSSKNQPDILLEQEDLDALKELIEISLFNPNKLKFEHYNQYI